VAAASMHLGVWSWSRRSPELQSECQNGKERGFKQFWAYFTICSVTGIFTHNQATLNNIDKLYIIW